MQGNIRFIDLVRALELSKVKVKLAPTVENKYFTSYTEVVDVNKLIHNLKEIGRDRER